MSKRSADRSGLVTALAALGAGALVVYGSRVLNNLYGPQPEYAIRNSLDTALDSEAFIRFLSLVTDGTRRCSRLRRLKNGAEFYPEQIRAIERAEHAINLETYEFLPGQVTGAMLDALTGRARAGVEVRLLIDAVGSWGMQDELFAPLRSAGGQVCWYHPLRWNTWQSMNQRTHRKLLVIDGRTGFIGGAGVADFWMHAVGTTPAWRDTMFCVEGEAVAGLISTFSENWLEASGEILSGAQQFGFTPMPGGAESFVVASTPRGGGTQARILFQALIKSARESIRITTPYFLPDRSAREALIEAASRGVQVQILTAGPYIDHPIVRTLSRHSSRKVVNGGVELYEYLPAMIHAKLMTIDGKWSVVGSTNFDHRSFSLNDEINLAVLDPELAAVIESDLAEDLKQSRRLTPAMLRERTPLGKVAQVFERVVEIES